MYLSVAATSSGITPEFMGLLVLGIMQIGNFWFNAARNKREEAAVTKAELKAVEDRLDGKIATLEKRIERKHDAMAENIREDFQNVFGQLKDLNAGVAEVSTRAEITGQRIVSVETKLEALINRKAS